MLLAVGLVVGLAVGVLLSRSDPDPTVATTTGARIASDPTTTTEAPAIPANEVSQGFEFGDTRFIPEDYGVADWLDLDGAIASQRCVKLGGREPVEGADPHISSGQNRSRDATTWPSQRVHG